MLQEIEILKISQKCRKQSVRVFHQVYIIEILYIFKKCIDSAQLMSTAHFEQDWTTMQTNLNNPE